jgi:hypothetical protein
MNSITTSDCGVRWQRPLCRPRCLAPGRGHGVGDEPLAWHHWTAPGSGVTDRSQTCVTPRQTPGLTWAFAWQVLDSNQGGLTSTVYRERPASVQMVATCANALQRATGQCSTAPQTRTTVAGRTSMALQTQAGRQRKAMIALGLVEGVRRWRVSVAGVRSEKSI